MSVTTVFLIVNVIGGTTVLGSYWLGIYYYIYQPESLWGGVNGSLRTFFTISMQPAALGYLAFFYFMVFKSGIDAFASSSLLGQQTQHAPSIICALFLTASTIWMPATISYVNSQEWSWWIAAVLSLWTTGFALVGLSNMFYVNTVESISWARNLALIGLLYITFHCVVLDAIIWVLKFPRLHN